MEARKPRGEPTPYLSVCSIYRNLADYLQEWIEFHRLVGVERFFLYDNCSEDEHLEVLAPYIEEGVVVLHYWPSPRRVRANRVAWGLVEAFEDCLAKHRERSRWIAFLDIDEFLFSPTLQKVSEILVEYEAWPGVCVSQAEFGTSGYRTRPPGLVIENYERRKSYPAGAFGAFKSVVDPKRTIGCWNAHRFVHQGCAVDENKQAVRPPPGKPQPVSFSQLRVNHYKFKSEEEYLRKEALWSSAGAERRFPSPDVRDVEETMNELDETIMAYVPALHQRLTRT